MHAAMSSSRIRIGDDAGIAVHCSDAPVEIASSRLHYHCERRKYLERVDEWFGLCLSPWDGGIRFGGSLDAPWKADPALDAKIRDAEEAKRRGQKKVGRNDPCVCGSGKKYKKCCLQR